MTQSNVNAVFPERLDQIRAEVDRVLNSIAAGGDHYSVMGIKSDASIDDIREAYRRAVEYLHPLKCRDIIELDGVMRWKLSQSFLRIVEAFSTLSRPGRRIEYDARRNRRPTAPLPVPPIRSGPLTKDQPAAQNLHSNRITLGHVSGDRQQPRRVSDRRRVPRLALRLPVHVKYGAGHSEMTESADVSRSGIRIQLTRRVEPGAGLALVLPMPEFLRTHSHNEKYYCVAAVVRHISHSGQAYVIGAEFVTRADSPEQRKLPEPAGWELSPDRRAATRITHLCQVQCEGESADPINTTMTDLSTKGAFINYSVSCQAGSRLKLRFQLLAADIQVTAEVRWQGLKGSGVCFLDLSPEHRETISLFVAAAEPEGPTTIESGQ